MTPPGGREDADATLDVLHIFTMFLALTVIVGGALLATTVIRRRDIDGMRTYFRLAPRIDSAGAILFVAGIVFGSCRRCWLLRTRCWARQPFWSSSA